MRSDPAGTFLAHPGRGRPAFAIAAVGLCLACAAPARVFFVERPVTLPAPAGRAASESVVRLRDRLYLLPAENPAARGANERAVESALAGRWGEAERVWTSLAGSDCSVRNNLALARYVGGRRESAFELVNSALGECPGDERIRWNFRALARPPSAPGPEYRVLE